jgi:flagellar biosynthetic protein FlhB
MPPNDSSEKTEQPTPQRLAEARQSGDVARSQDMTSSVLIAGVVLGMFLFGTQMVSTLMALLRNMLASGPAENAAKPDAVHLLVIATKYGAEAILPLALSLMVLAAVIGVMQVGFLITGKQLVPNFSKLSPARGIKQIVSVRSLMRLVMSLLKVSIVALVVGIGIWVDLPYIVALIHLDASQLMATFGVLLLSMCWKVALVLVILGLIDFWYQKWQKHQEMLMSKQDVKEELKRMEGDPLVKQRRTKVARQLAMQRLSVDVPKADVVVTNPTHVSVALSYDSGKMDAPRVVAKGADFMALRIRQIASANGVPMVERPPLARALHASVEVGDEVPAHHYAAVAEILAYVYRLNGRKIA